MRIKTRTVPCTVIQTNQYSSKVTSQWRSSTDIEPDWGIRMVPYGAAGKLRKCITRNGTQPSGLQGQETIQYETSTWYRRWFDVYRAESFKNYTVYLPCLHTKTVYMPEESYYYGGYYQWRYYGQELRDQSSFTRGVWYPGLYGNTPKTIQSHIVSESRFREAANCALLHLLAGKPRRPMNVALAVCELKDLPGTIRQLATFSKWCWKACKGQLAGRGPNGLLRLLDSIRRQGLKANLRTLAQAYLWESFGVEPTVADIRRFIDDIRSEKLHVSGAKPRDRLVTGLTYRSYFDLRDYEPDSRGQPQGWPSLNRTEFAAYREPKNWQINTATACQYNLRIITEEYHGCVFAKLRPEGVQFQRYFPTSFNWGNPIFSTAWELVPFSFVVDWFLDVGKAVQRLDDLTWVSWARLAWDEPWIAFAKVRREWYPQITFIHSVVPGRILPPEPWWSGWHNAQYTCLRALTQSGSWYPGKETRTFRRAKASELGVSYRALLEGMIPEQKVQFKRYQITTGMALVVSLSKMFR